MRLSLQTSTATLTALATVLISTMASAQTAQTTSQTTTNADGSSTTTATTTPMPATTTTVVQPAPVVAPQAPVSTTQTTSAPYMMGVPHDETVDRNVYYPNVALIGTGLVVFGAPYVASAIVSGESNHQGDKHLWIPVVGPWMDFADRGQLPPNQGRNTEVFSRVLLAGDGALQAIGLLEIAGGLLFPSSHEEKTVTTTPETASLHVTPMQLSPQSYGLGAYGKF